MSTPHTTEPIESIPDRPPAQVVASLEDHRPPADPERWDSVYQVIPGEPCPDCGTAIGLLLAPAALLEDHVDEVMRDYPVTVPDGWTEGYEHPVYFYCDSPVCSWHGAAEWRRVGPALEQWIGRGAPTWRDRVTQEGEA
ncbi:hypothetical protein [Halovivax cerinus]|uniref:Uncharacterized protein n=1 Tax=Halovivax cerinus TaxID=1487865 RepID=A0ABD5NLH5_9EURY|nr:hypothetical protein [Halovivax cerinus]